MKMKNKRITFSIPKFLILTLVLLIFTSSKDVQSGSYQAGWDAGYSDGFCYQDPNCVSPISPLCPVPTVNEENTYSGGYQRGFSEGLNDQD